MFLTSYKFQNSSPKVQISAINSNFQFKFPKNSPLNFKFRLKISTFPPAPNKNQSTPVASILNVTESEKL